MFAPDTSMSNECLRFITFLFLEEKLDTALSVYNTALQIQAILAVTLLVPLETFGMWYIHTQMVIPMNRFAAAVGISVLCAVTGTSCSLADYHIIALLWRMKRWIIMHTSVSLMYWQVRHPYIIKYF